MTKGDTNDVAFRVTRRRRILYQSNGFLAFTVRSTDGTDHRSSPANVCCSPDRRSSAAEGPRSRSCHFLGADRRHPQDRVAAQFFDRRTRHTDPSGAPVDRHTRPSDQTAWKRIETNTESRSPRNDNARHAAVGVGTIVTELVTARIAFAGPVFTTANSMFNGSPQATESLRATEADRTISTGLHCRRNCEFCSRYRRD
jgi:hypothetical protein